MYIDACTHQDHTEEAQVIIEAWKKLGVPYQSPKIEIEIEIILSMLCIVFNESLKVASLTRSTCIVKSRSHSVELHFARKWSPAEPDVSWSLACFDVYYRPWLPRF